MKIVAGNWKMHKTIDEAQVFFREFAALALPLPQSVEVVIFPDYIALGALAGTALNGVTLGAQDVAADAEGAFTGEVSPMMIRSTGAKYVLIGHSERRHVFGESLDVVRRKLLNAMAGSLVPVLCVGETLAERTNGRTAEIVREQLDNALSDTARIDPDRLVVAYEPVWAIGTGINAENDQIEEMHNLIRDYLGQLLGDCAGRGIPILYGGSVKPANFRSIIALPSVAGGLVGGASLMPASFAELVKIAAQC